ncbi:MAG: DUF192 domain-containing protein [Candidatus Woesebacteria bacterium]
MKKIILLLITIVAIFLLGSFILKKSPVTQNESQDTITVGSQKLAIERAKTIPEITLGLGKRDTLGSDGMLFVMPARDIPTFWMKDMRFDLDFVWIDSNKVVDLTEKVSAQKGEPDSALRFYSPITPVTHVLEMNAGEVQKRGIKIGDSVQL